MSRLAEALATTPIDTAAVHQALWDLSHVSDADFFDEILEARRALRFEGNLAIWRYQNATIKLAVTLLSLPLSVREVCVNNL